VKAVGEFRGLILATTVWFEVPAVFIFAVCIFCNFENIEMLKMDVGHEPTGSQINSSL